MNRYHRQTLLPQIGAPGQQTLSASRVLLVGCGALGTVAAEQLVRAGVGFLRLADRDVVELTNLQRQVLFDEDDARDETPKAMAAAARLRKINADVTVEPHVTDVHAGNVEDLAGVARDSSPVDLILDGTDNVETRYLLNDVAVKHTIPWVYGACVGMEGRVMAVRPPVTPCLRCVFPTPPAPGTLPTCDTAGVFAPASAVVASLQVAAAVKMLLNPDASQPLVSFDVDAFRFRSTNLEGAKHPDCPTCGGRVFEFLDSPRVGYTTGLCGRNAVQVRPAGRAALDLDRVADKLHHAGRVDKTPYLVRCKLDEPAALNLTVFPDGRLIVHGTTSADRARSIYARYLGN